MQLIQAILSEYKHIETFLESSAKKQQSIPDIFYYAVKSIVHPAEPLVEFNTGQLKPLCVKALKRVFLLCDENGVSHPQAHMLALAAHFVHVTQLHITLFQDPITTALGRKVCL